MRAAILALVFVGGCQESSRSPTHDQTVPAIASASQGPGLELTDECLALRSKWDRDVARFAGKPQTCERNEECDCFGGPVCPNAFVSVCPGPVRADAASALVPHMEAWTAKGCPVIWSPHQCEPACVNGRCVSAR